MKRSYRASIVGLCVNIILFIVKLVAGLLSNSIAIISDAFNSLSDIFASLAVIFGTRISSKAPDKSHPMGHRQAEPVAALVIAIFAGILGFEIITSSVKRLIFPETIIVDSRILWLVFFVILVKLFVYVFYNKNSKDSPAITAAAIDARNDILFSGLVYVAVLCDYYHILYVDSVVALVIGFFIIYSGYMLSVRNIDYLMSKSPDDDLIKDIGKSVSKLKIPGKIRHLRAHYVGNFVHVYLTFIVDSRMSSKKSHDLSELICREIEKNDHVDRAFVHVDYK